jgi:hypothetical protein
MKRTFLLLAFLATAALSQITAAAPITYTINRLMPSLVQNGVGIISGTITTNGKLGVISNADITSYAVQTTLILDKVTTIGELMTPFNSSLGSVLGVTANTDSLFLDGSVNLSLFSVGGYSKTDVNNWFTSLSTAYGSLQQSVTANNAYGFSLNPNLAKRPDWRVELATTSGRLTQGAIQSAAAVPLPSSALLIAIGIGAFYKRNRKTN